MRHLLAAALVALSAFAGCAQAPEPDPEPTPDAPVLSKPGTWPDGASARGYIESYVMTHPYRAAGSAMDQQLGTMAKARDGLVALLEGMGNLTVVREAYEGGENILAIRNATVAGAPWLVISAHYDSAGSQTVYGAWDDGAGVALLLELARATADWSLPYTIVFAFFDGEEKGLLGSKAFVQRHVLDGEQDIIANINSDPPGLNWPCGDPSGPFAVKVIHELDRVQANETADADRFTWLHHAIEAGLAGAQVPAGVRDYSPGVPVAEVLGVGLSGTSDHASFGAADVANVFLGGLPATRAQAEGQVVAGVLTYPLHTPLDTLEAMDGRCAAGGPGSTLANGLQTILDTTAHSLVWMAENPAPLA